MNHKVYGNAAGLLLAHGLLAGGQDSGQENYSSDSETSDTEEYQKSKKQYVKYHRFQENHGHLLSLPCCLRLTYVGYESQWHDIIV